jgi:hypothetical protein
VPILPHTHKEESLECPIIMSAQNDDCMNGGCAQLCLCAKVSFVCLSIIPVGTHCLHAHRSCLGVCTPLCPYGFHTYSDLHMCVCVCVCTQVLVGVYTIPPLLFLATSRLVVRPLLSWAKVRVCLYVSVLVCVCVCVIGGGVSFCLHVFARYTAGSGTLLK